jgi:ubiquinone biosynthesis monooxygenase Coq6
VPPADSHFVPPLVLRIQAGTVASFPLKFNHTESYLGEGSGARTVLVGDAAHTVHPLAGQGLNLGLADVECLAKCIQDALLQGGDVGKSPSSTESSDHQRVIFRFIHGPPTLYAGKVP